MCDSDSCFECQRGHQLAGMSMTIGISASGSGQCEECSIKNCLHCEADKCLECKEGLFIEGGECVIECSSNYFINHGKYCDVCSEGCSTC
jgi:hypothetical protein